MDIKSAILKYQDKVFPILDVALNGVNYFFHVFCSWYVSQQSYGTLNALLSILAILLVAGISFQTYTAKEVAQNGVAAKRIYKTAFLYIAVLTTIFLLLIEQINNFTRSSYLSLGLLFAVFILNLFLSILRGIFQGEKQFFNLNMNFYVEDLAKVFFVVILLPIYNHIDIVLLGLVFGMGIGVVHGIIKLKIGTLVVKNQGDIAPVAKSLSIIYLSNFFIYYYTSIDMVIFNYKLHEISGVYAVVLRYSQIILFISFSLITVFIPNLSTDVKNKVSFNDKVRKYFFILAGIQLLILIGYITVFPLSVEYLFGEKYIEAANYLFMGSIMYIMLVNSFYLVNINIILERKIYIFSLGGIAVLFTLFLLNYGEDIETFLKGGIFFYTFLFLLLAATFIFEEMSEDGKRKQKI